MYGAGRGSHPSSDFTGWRVLPIPPKLAARTVVAHHYLHRRPPISYAYGLQDPVGLVRGVVTFGTPASPHLQRGACPTDPAAVIELNRLWLDDDVPHNGETFLVARALRALPPRIVVSYADTAHGHQGYIYRAANFRYAGWTDMDRKTPRFDYVPTDPTKHSRDVFRAGGKATPDLVRVRRMPKVRYWTTTGTRREQRALASACGWPALDWKSLPPPSATDTTTNEGTQAQ